TLVELTEADLGGADRHVMENRADLAHGADRIVHPAGRIQVVREQGPNGGDLPGGVWLSLPVSLAAIRRRPPLRCRGRRRPCRPPGWTGAGSCGRVAGGPTSCGR